MNNISYIPVFEYTSPDQFYKMIEVTRYLSRHNVFQKLISKSIDHSWDPFDPKYIELLNNFDVEKNYVLNPMIFDEFNSAVIDAVDKNLHIKFANDLTHFSMSQILHGEQGALSLSASLCLGLLSPETQEYAANQVREEARHVSAFSTYIQLRWGLPMPVGKGLGNLLQQLISESNVNFKIIGMQILVEGLAVGVFKQFKKNALDPTLKRLISLVLIDEAFHHQFGKEWASISIPELSSEDRNTIEDWAVGCFNIILYNLVGIEQKASIYQKYNLDTTFVRNAMIEAFSKERMKTLMSDQDHFLNFLMRTLYTSGIITDRTKHIYEQYFDFDDFSLPEMQNSDPELELLETELLEINKVKNQKTII